MNGMFVIAKVTKENTCKHHDGNGTQNGTSLISSKVYLGDAENIVLLAVHKGNVNLSK